MRQIQSVKYNLYDGCTPEGHMFDSAVEAKNAVVDNRYLSGKTYSIKKILIYTDGTQEVVDFQSGRL